MRQRVVRVAPPRDRRQEPGAPTRKTPKGAPGRLAARVDGRLDRLRRAGRTQRLGLLVGTAGCGRPAPMGGPRSGGSARSTRPDRTDRADRPPRPSRSGALGASTAGIGNEWCAARRSSGVSRRSRGRGPVSWRGPLLARPSAGRPSLGPALEPGLHLRVRVLPPVSSSGRPSSSPALGARAPAPSTAPRATAHPAAVGRPATARGLHGPRELGRPTRARATMSRCPVRPRSGATSLAAAHARSRRASPTVTSAPLDSPTTRNAGVPRHRPSPHRGHGSTARSTSGRTPPPGARHADVNNRPPLHPSTAWTERRGPAARRSPPCPPARRCHPRSPRKFATPPMWPRRSTGSVWSRRPSPPTAPTSVGATRTPCAPSSRSPTRRPAWPRCGSWPDWPPTARASGARRSNTCRRMPR